LPKYTTLHLTPPTLLEILALSLTNMLPSLSKIHLSSKPVTITFVSFAVSGLTLIPQLPVPLLPLSFTPNLTTVILSTIDSLSLNYPVFSRSRTLLACTVVKASKSCYRMLCPLAQNQFMHRIQAPLSYLQSPQLLNL